MTGAHRIATVVLAAGGVIAGVGTWLHATRGRGASDVASSALAGDIPRADVSVDLRRQQLIGVRTVRVLRTPLRHITRTVGRVSPVEPRVYDINMKVDGWIRELAVDRTGQQIRRGQPLLTLYSPDLLAAQNDYLLTLRTRDSVLQSAPDARTQVNQIVNVARRKLEQLDVPPEDILALERSRVATGTAHFLVQADGVVLEKQAIAGLHVSAGQTLFRVADLSIVQVEAEIYESELADIAIGGLATLTIDAYPAKTFSGRVARVYPYLDEKTRTNTVQIEIANRDARLKPGMFAEVALEAGSGSGLTVPTDAVLDSGADQVVFVARGNGIFEPRHVTVGRRLDDAVQILGGVHEGDLVATGAAFLLDSESRTNAAFPSAETFLHASDPASASAIVLRTQPDPPTAGENLFEVIVTDARGMPVDNADVSVQLLMPAMPSMNMPAMRSDVKPVNAGGGVYRGTGPIMMPGRWNATVTVRNGERRLGVLERPILVR